MVTRKIVLRFPKRLTDRPIVSRLIKEYDMEMNILKAQITPAEEGLMVIELKCKQDKYDSGIKYLKDAGVIIDSLSQNVIRNEERCTHCGACVAICPANAFELDDKTKKVEFIGKKCIVCGLCIKACPPRAMEVHF